MIERRLSAFRSSSAAILSAYREAGVPISTVDSARSELDTFREVAAVVDGVRRARAAGGRAAGCVDPFDEDVEELCAVDDDVCMVEYSQFTQAGDAAALLEAVNR